MILLIPFYQDADANRRAEFIECLRRNSASAWLDVIHFNSHPKLITSGANLNKYYACLSIRHHPLLVAPSDAAARRALGIRAGVGRTRDAVLHRAISEV